MLMSFNDSSNVGDTTLENNIACQSSRVIFAGDASCEVVALVSQHAPQRMPMILSHPSFAFNTGCIIVELVDDGASSFGRCEEVQTAFRVCFENLFGSAERSRIGLSMNKSMQLFLYNVAASVVCKLGQRRLKDETKTKIRNAAKSVMDICMALKNWLPLDAETTRGWAGCHLLCFVLEITNPRLFDSSLPPALVVFLEQIFEVVVQHEKNAPSFSSSCSVKAILKVSTIDCAGPSRWIVDSPVWHRVRYIVRSLNELLEMATSPSSPRMSPLLRSW